LAGQNIQTHVYALREDAQYQQLAAAGRGHVQPFTLDDSDLQQIKSYFANQQAQAQQQTQQEFSIRTDQGHYLLWWLLPVALLAFRRGWLERLMA